NCIHIIRPRNPWRWITMERKNKITAVAKETGLARTTPWNFGWFEDMDRWFDNVRRTFEDRFWGGPLARWTGSDAPVREPLVDVRDPKKQPTPESKAVKVPVE